MIYPTNIPFEVSSLTDVGRIRDENQDAYGFFETANGSLFIVCDGMGGHAGGKIASAVAVESIKDYFMKTSNHDIRDLMKNAILYANQAILEKSKTIPGLYGMGTTLVLAVLFEGKIYYAHVGDSRIYFYSKGIFKQITKDHSFVQLLVDQKILTPDEAKMHPRSNEILKALGTEDELEPSISEDTIIPHDNDFLLLCTDGLTNMMSEETLESISTSDEDIEDIALQLVNTANQNGGKDNITVQIVRFGKPEMDRKKHDNSYFINKRNYLIISILLFIMVISYIQITHKFTTQSYTNKRLKNDSIHIIPKKFNDTILVYTLKANEKIDSIAERFNVSVKELNELNQQNTEMLQEGQSFRIPVVAIHKVSSDENLSIIENIYKIPKELIIKANDLNSLELTEGQILCIPKNIIEKND